MRTRRIVLIGFSGTGKSTVAAYLAAALRWRLIDVDVEIEASVGKPIPAIFAEDGESRFRQVERAHLLSALSHDHVVIATGGGAVVAEALWTEEALRSLGTLTVALDAEPETILDRLHHQVQQGEETIERPMLTGDDQLTRVRELKASRQAAYDRAHLTLVVDKVSAEEIAHEIISVFKAAEHDVKLEAPGGSSRIVIQPDSLSRVGGLARERWKTARRAWLITDENVGPLHAGAAAERLREQELEVETVTVPAREASKSWERAGELLDQLLFGGIQRNDIVVALGGGVVGDLAGFVAAVVLRGVGLIQVPTSLLAMVDSSVGGKTAVNHPAGKNLIGAFYQPPLVVIDPELLRTLPPRELTQSWAEVVKHAVIQPSTPGGERADLIRFLERNRAALAGVGGPAMTYLIRRNVALKAAVVEADEREASLRAILNYGHTIGHAIEAADYRYRHGEAVAVGMRAANRIAALTGCLDDEHEVRLNALIASFGLPTSAEFDSRLVLARMQSDKKQTAGSQRWVLPVDPAGVEIVTGIPGKIVNQALSSVAAPEPGSRS